MGVVKELLPEALAALSVVALALAERWPGRKLRARMALSRRMHGSDTTSASCRPTVLSREEVAVLAASHGYYIVDERPSAAGMVQYKFRRAPLPAHGVAWWCA